MNPRANKTSQRFRRKEPFRPAISPFVVIYDPEHYITVKPPPPPKGFINIRNCEGVLAHTSVLKPCNTKCITTVNENPFCVLKWKIMWSSVCKDAVALFVLSFKSTCFSFLHLTWAAYWLHLFLLFLFYYQILLPPFMSPSRFYHHANKARLKQNDNLEEPIITLSWEPKDNTNHTVLPLRVLLGAAQNYKSSWRESIQFCNTTKICSYVLFRSVSIWLTVFKDAKR